MSSKMNEVIAKYSSKTTVEAGRGTTVTLVVKFDESPEEIMDAYNADEDHNDITSMDEEAAYVILTACLLYEHQKPPLYWKSMKANIK